MAVASFLGVAGLAHGQEAPLLRSSLDGDQAATAEEAATTGEEAAPPVTTALAVPAEEEQPVIRKKAAKAEDPYAAPGISAGAFRLYPTLEMGAVYTSNVSRSAAGAGSDVGFRIKPGLRFESDWVRHSLTGTASGEVVRYLDNSDLSSLNGSVESALRLDIRRTTKADITLRYTLTETGTEDSEVPATAIGNRRDHLFAASSALSHDLGPVEARVTAGLNRQIYEDVELSGGGMEDNGDRDYWEPVLALRGTYKYGARVTPFVEATYTPRIHDERKDRNGEKRDSQGLTVAAGVSFVESPVWSGELAVNWLVRDYDDDALATNSAVGLSGNLTWRPTDLTSIVLSTSTALNETATAGSSGTKSWTGGVTVTHALRDNLDLIAGAGLTAEKADSGTSLTSTAKLGLDWQVNPYLSWALTYDGTWFETDGDDWNEQRLTAGIVLRR
jgi:hypothetical protein